tara:strand:+ start:4602 stop:4994 length:393 start_codon:yes stop_codon:yes gene_type:complete
MNKTIFPSLFLTIIGIFILTSAGFSQKNTYEVATKNNVANISDYTDAMDKADFDSYRYINKTRKITFKSGVVIELLSANELKEKNISFDASKASIYNSKTETNHIYHIGNKGHILAGVETKFNGKRYEAK